MKNFGLMITVLTLAFGCEAATAATIVPDRATLNDLLGETAINEDFESFDLHGQPVAVLGPSVDSESQPGLVVDGVSFSAFGNYLSIRDAGFLGGTQELDVGGSGPRTLMIDFAPNITAFGIDFVPFVTVGTDVNLTVLGADDVTVLMQTSIVAYSRQFIGIADTQDIGAVLISASPPDFNIFDVIIDNVIFGSSKVVSEPEPGTFALVGLGLLGLGTTRRRAAK